MNCFSKSAFDRCRFLAAGLFALCLSLPGLSHAEMITGNENETSCVDLSSLDLLNGFETNEEWLSEISETGYQASVFKWSEFNVDPQDLAQHFWYSQKNSTEKVPEPTYAKFLIYLGMMLGLVALERRRIRIRRFDI